MSKDIVLAPGITPTFNPYEDPSHPSNWPAWKRHAQLVTLAWSAFVANFLAGAHLPIFEPIAVEFGVSITAVANSIGIGILGLGLGALLWSPLASSIGRRPVYLLVWTLMIPLSLWIAFAPNYSNFAAARFFACFCGSATQILPVASIAELYKPEWRGTAISFWSLLLIMGPPSAPLITAADTLAHGWRYCYYVVVIFVGSVWIMTIFFCQETLYSAPAAATSGSQGHHSTVDGDDKKMVQDATNPHIATQDVESIASMHGSGSSGRVGAVYNPLKEPGRFFKAAIEPFTMGLFIPEILCALWGAVIFAWSVGYTIVLPQMLPRPPYGFNSIKVGCAYLPALVGALIGKLYGGVGSDWTVSYFARRNGTGREPEYRCWNMIPPTVLLIVGTVVFGYGLGERQDWWVPIIFGVGTYYAAMVGVTGPLQTYMSECYLSKSLASLALYNFCKCVLAFGTPFFIAEWSDLPAWEKGDGSGFKLAYLEQGIIAVVLGLLLMAYLIMYGKRTRVWQGMPTTG